MLALYKQKGETPLQTLNRLRQNKPELASISLSYAGRLDPMAEGVMLVLVGEECKNRKKHLGLDKTYVTEVLFGVGTDTGDVLGKIKNKTTGNIKIEKKKIEEELKKRVGKFEQKYPTYSSKSFAGDYEKVRTRDETEKMSHEVELYSAELLNVREMSATDLLTKIKQDVGRVVGDFRQDEILKDWGNYLSDASHIFLIAEIRLSVSSGFYVRQFAEDMGESLGLPALALSILREKVGEWGVGDEVLVASF